MGHDLYAFVSELVVSQYLYCAECVFDILVFACVKIINGLQGNFRSFD